MPDPTCSCRHLTPAGAGPPGRRWLLPYERAARLRGEPRISLAPRGKVGLSLGKLGPGAEPEPSCLPLLGSSLACLGTPPVSTRKRWERKSTSWFSPTLRTPFCDRCWALVSDSPWP